ncbi:perilipin-2-like isoform X2 [Lineus longissimus]|uniref:perilipin-2-like isoform X2 n=1 Tax=Lineus longissimus TaxID=88925 RepID=UPI002B4CC96C
MYRRDLKKKEMETNVVCRVTNYPIVSSALGQVTGFYEKTKDSNRLLKYTLETGESCLKTVSSSALPVVNKFEKPIESLNSVACDQLSKLEEKYPIITKPTDEVLEETKIVYDKNLKPSVDKVIGAAQYTVDTVNGVKKYGTEKVASATQYGVDTVNGVKDYTTTKITDVANYGIETVNHALETPYGQVVAQKLDTALTLAEQYTDKYLPEDETEPEAKGDELAKETGTEKASIARVTTLTNKVRQRMFTRAMKDFQNMQTRSKVTLDKLNFTVDLIQYAKTNIDSANQKVHDGFSGAQQMLKTTWDEINKEEDADQDTENTEEGKTLNRRAILVARHLTMKLKTGFNAAMETTHNLPDAARERLGEALKYSEELYESFKKVGHVDELSTMVLDQAKVKVTNIQETMAYLTDVAVNSWALSWLGFKRVDFENGENGSETEMEDLTEKTDA